jgi:hypothetical protein
MESDDRLSPVDQDANGSQLRLVYERRPPKALALVLLSLLLLCFVPVSNSEPMVQALGEALGPLRGRVNANLLDRAIAGTVLVVAFLPPLLLAGMVRWLARRYGRAVIEGGHVTLGFPFLPASLLEGKIALRAFTGRRVTPHGVELSAPWQLLVRTTLYPFAPPLVPLKGEQALAELLARLDSVEDGRERAPLVLGKGGLRRAALALGGATLLVTLSVAAGAVVVLQWNVGAGGTLAVATGSLLFLTALCALFPLRAFTWALVRPALVEDVLYLGARSFVIRDADELALGENMLAVREGKQRSTVYLEAAQASEMRDQLVARGRHPAEELPAWGTPRRRIAVGLLSLLLPLLACAGLASVAWATPSFESTRWRDAYGQGLHLSFHRDGRVAACVLLPADDDVASATIGALWLTEASSGWSNSLLRLDLANRQWSNRGSGDSGSLSANAAWVWSGTTAPRALEGEVTGLASPSSWRGTSHVIRRATQEIELLSLAINPLGLTEIRGSLVSTPSILEEALPDLPPGPLRDYARGRTSTRCFDERDLSGESLIAGVRRGRVVFLVILPPGEEAWILQGGMGFATSDQPQGPARLNLPGQECARVLASGQPRTTALPTYAELLRAVDRVREGESVDTVARELAPGLYD